MTWCLQQQVMSQVLRQLWGSPRGISHAGRCKLHGIQIDIRRADVESSYPLLRCALEAERVQVSLPHGSRSRLYGTHRCPGSLQQGLALGSQPGRRLLLPRSLHYMMLSLCCLFWLCSRRLANLSLPAGSKEAYSSQGKKPWVSTLHQDMH